MENVLSILKFVNNPISEENIALGLVVISNDKVFFKLSNQKIDLVKKLNSNSAKLLDFSLNQLRNYLAHDLEDRSMNLIEFKSKVNKDFLVRLSKYNNGILQFSQPSFIKSEVNTELFHDYFLKFIGEDSIEKLKVISEPSRLFSNVQEKFSTPLRDRIDIDYTIRKKQLPSLFFDFNFDGIGVNGALYVVKSVDLDAVKIGSANTTISEYESVIERLNVFAKIKGIDGDPRCFLVMDSPKTKSVPIVELYSLLKNEEMPFFKLVGSDQLDSVSNLIIEKEAHKISDLLLA
jgi:hypothetical protein